MSDCDFCHGKPVQNAASWTDGNPRPPAACPRCGGVSVEGQEQAAWIALTNDPGAYTSTRPREVFAHGYRAALVGSEARERELEAERDEAVGIVQRIYQKVWDYHPPSSSRLEAGEPIQPPSKPSTRTDRNRV